MYEENEENKIVFGLIKENSFLWKIILKNYETLAMIQHDKCKHTEIEMNLIILYKIIDDLSAFGLFAEYFSEFVYRKIEDFSFQFINGFSMMPELNPADFVITKIIREIDDVKVGDIVGGRDRRDGMGCIHRVIHKTQEGVITQGNSNSSQEIMSKETISEKIIIRIERENEMWNFLVKNPHLKQICIESIDSTLVNEIKGYEKEVEYLKNLKKRLEGKDELILMKEDGRKFFRDKDGKVDKNAKKGFKS